METTVTPSGNALIDGNILDLESRDLKGHYGIGGKKSGGGCTVSVVSASTIYKSYINLVVTAKNMAARGRGHFLIWTKKT